ncbi:hypothetical protein ACOME3_000676 [Neoechinorhynchus agilis]
MSDESSKTPLAPLRVREQWTIKDLPLWALENLPEGWIKVTHDSGIPMFLHKATQVVTFSRPYFLGDVTARSHKVPVAAIPCIFYNSVSQPNLKISLTTPIFYDLKQICCLFNFFNIYYIQYYFF